MPEDSLIVITNAIKTAVIDHPSSGHGTTWDQITKSDEESIHLAKAVLIALRKAGYSISKVEDENARGPKGEKRTADVMRYWPTCRASELERPQPCPRLGPFSCPWPQFLVSDSGETWPMEITETKFYEKISRMPQAKTRLLLASW